MNLSLSDGSPKDWRIFKSYQGLALSLMPGHLEVQPSHCKKGHKINPGPQAVLELNLPQVEMELDIL